MNLADSAFLILIIIFSVIVHEVMHGVAADYLGDKTARYAGRLTLNPIPHIDLVGSIIIPVLLTLSQSPIFFGWAKPVPYNPYNLRPGRFSEAIVAFAGPFSNLVIALLAGIAVRFVSADLASVIFTIVVINVMLCLFNLIPIPPLDGSKVLEALLPRGMRHGYQRWRGQMEMNPFLGMGIVLLVIVALGSSFSTAVYALAGLIAGV